MAVNRVMLTQDQAQALVDAHEIKLDETEEETQLIYENNPTLYLAYEKLLKIADGQ